MGCRWDLTLQQGPYCRAGDLGFRQCYTPGRNIHAPDRPPPYFLTARCLHAPSQDLQSTWHVTASRESQDNFPPSPLLASLQTLPLLPPRPRFPGCNHRVAPRGVPRGQHNPCATCRTGACQGRSRALGDVYSSPWVAPALQGAVLRHSSHAQSEPMATQRHRGNRAGGSNSLGVPRSESHPARVAQHKHGPTDASGMQATPQIRGKPSEHQEIQSPMPTVYLPDPREPRAAEPWGSLGTVSVGPARSCLLCQHGHPSANLTKPTSTGAVPVLGQGPKHRHCSHGTHTHTERGWGCTGHPVGAVTSQPRPCTDTGHIQHPWPETPEKAPQLMITAEPFQGAEIDSTVHRSCAGRGGEHCASSSCVT